ncbi:MAG: hypothetical protein WBQ73_04175 [Candidatus Babeliales bacterium]
MVQSSGQHMSVSFIDKIKHSLQWDTWKKNFAFSQEALTEVGIYLGIGFVLGFLLKKYSTFVVIVTLTVVGFVVLQHVGVLSFSINWTMIYEKLGFEPLVYGDNFLNTYWQWASENVRIVISLIVGFLVGLKVG